MVDEDDFAINSDADGDAGVTIIVREFARG